MARIIPESPDHEHQLRCPSCRRLIGYQALDVKLDREVVGGVAMIQEILDCPADCSASIILRSTPEVDFRQKVLDHARSLL